MNLEHRNNLIDQIINARQLQANNDVLLELAARLHDECRRINLAEIHFGQQVDIGLSYDPLFEAITK